MKDKDAILDKTERALQKNDWPLETHSGLTLCLSPFLKNVSSLVHAFTTRLGGGTPAPLDSFNLGRHWNTDESRIDAMENRRILCNLFSIDSKKLAVPGQQHTNNVHILKDDETMQSGPFHFPGIDAIATELRQQPVLLHFADCVPVILVDTKKEKFCVIHAGWRGTASGIVRKSVELMVDQLDCSPADITAAIGPAIGSCCYETGNEVVENLNNTVKDSDSLTTFKEGKPFPDLKAYNAMQLVEAGVESIDVSNWCTACHPEIFYSHRQSGGVTGRQGTLACFV